MTRRGFLVGLVALAISRRLPRFLAPKAVDHRIAPSPDHRYDAIQRSIRVNSIAVCRVGGVVTFYPAGVRYLGSV